ncbi:hypothetical protein N9A04_01030, partial [Rickettsiales bacterium]|nr:hypothetical protein [Rickettsiales bacterium]
QKYIQDNYGSENEKFKQNFETLLQTSAISDTQKIIILPVDQGFEHGPHKSFMKNPKGFDPWYHYNLASHQYINGFAAPMGMLESTNSLSKICKKISFEEQCKYNTCINTEHDQKIKYVPTILKLNSNNYFYSSDKSSEPDQCFTASTEDAVRLGCIGIGITIYPGSKNFNKMAEKAAKEIREAKKHGLVVIIWAYPRGALLNNSNNDIDSKRAQNTVDVTAYAAHIACLMGAHIVKVKLPSELQQTYWKENQDIASCEGMVEAVKKIKESCFDGRRMVIFSGGSYNNDQDLIDLAKAIKEGGGDGLIIGRNLFQRTLEDANQLINDIAATFQN